MNFRSLPKIELHCHLDGSLRTETIIDIAEKENISLPTYCEEEMKELIAAPIDCHSLVEYLNRFKIPAQVLQSKDSLRRVAYELMEDAAKENVKYIEIRFAPPLHVERGLTLEEVIKSVIDGIKKGEEDFNIKGNLILSCLKHMGTESVFQVVEAGKVFLGKGVVAIDLCGAEDKGFVKSFVEPIALARRYGYRVTIHAGETGFGENVYDAIELLKAERIGHGVSIKDYRAAYDLVKNKGIFLEMCPTSNLQTKIIDSFENHPIYKYHKDGIKIGFNTDNRTVSQTNVTNEFESIYKFNEITKEDYKEIYYNSVDASFLEKADKAALKELFN